MITSVMQSPGHHLSVTSDVVHLFRIFGFFLFCFFIEDLILLASSILLSRTCLLVSFADAPAYTHTSTKERRGPITLPFRSTVHILKDAELLQ